MFKIERESNNATTIEGEKERTSKYARERVGEVRKKRTKTFMRERRLDDAKEERVRGRTQGSSERERQLVAFSRDDAPHRAAGSVSPRCGGKTRLVSLSLITILCVVVDDEGRRRASGPVYRQQENRPVCVRACAATGRAVRA